MGKTRVYVNELLEPVEAGSPEAAYVYNKADLAAAQDLRREMGLAKNDEALRTFLESQQVEQAKAQRRLAAVQAENDAIEEAVSAFRASLKAAQKAGAAGADAEAEKSSDDDAAAAGTASEAKPSKPSK